MQQITGDTIATVFELVFKEAAGCFEVEMDFLLQSGNHAIVVQAQGL